MKIDVNTPKKHEKIIRSWRPTIDLHGRHPRVYRGYRARIKDEQEDAKDYYSAEKKKLTKEPEIRIANAAVWAHNCAKRLPGTIDLIEQQTDRITKLEAELAEMHKCALEVAGFLAEKKNLEDEIKELKESLKNEKEWVSQYQKWLIEEVAEGMSENGFADDDLRQKARDSLILDGKIGTDADAKSRVWKITKDRVDALKGEINGYDVYDNDIETHSLKMRRKNVLKTMLKEATD